MRDKPISVSDQEKKKCITEIIELLKENKLDDCEQLLKVAISKYPHDPEPHNLYGILFEKKYDHNMGMKHFRAAWDLDPTYLPARHNLEHYGTFVSRGYCAYDESDITQNENENENASEYNIVYDTRNIGRINRRRTNEA